MVANEYGPFGLLVAVRRATGVEHTNAGTPTMWQANHVLMCPWCLSVWVAPIMLRFPWLSALFAVSAAAIMVEKVMDDGI